MIDRKEINEIILNSYIDDSNLTLLLFENKQTKKDPLSVYALNINNDIVAQSKGLAKEYVNFLLNLIRTEEIDSIPIYNPDYEQDLFKIESDKVELFQELYKYVSSEKPNKIYKQEDIKEEKLKAWLFRFECQINKKLEQIIFFQKFQPSKMLGSKRIAIFQNDKVFQLLDKNILNLNMDMDFMYFKNTFIVTRMSSFERIFGYEEFYKESANELIAQLKESEVDGMNYSVKFSDIESVSIKINGSTRLAHKLYSAKVNEYYKKIDYKKLVDLNQKHNFQLSLNDSNREWSIDENTDLNIMARILNDDYERSLLTDNEYIAMGKETLIET